MVLISNVFIDFSMNERIITKLLQFQTSNWHIPRIRIDPRNLPVDSRLLSLQLPEWAGLASATDHFFFFGTLCNIVSQSGVDEIASGMKKITMVVDL